MIERVAFVSDTVPRSAAHGGAVYPALLAKALACHGIAFDTIVPDVTSRGRAPVQFSADDHIVAGWKHVGKIAFSPSPYDWSLFVYRAARTMLRKLRRSTTADCRTSLLASSISIRDTRHTRQEPKIVARRLMAAAARHPGRIVMVNLPYRLASINSTDFQHKRLFVLTHDIIHERVETYARNGWPLDFPALTRDEEASLLARADVIVAISYDDAATIRAMLPNSRIVVAFPPFIRKRNVIHAEPRASNGLRCLYVGGGARHNRETLQEILKAWPDATRNLTGLQLDVAGGVGVGLTVGELPAGVNILGRLADLRPAYSNADLALALVLDGSGVKIKLLEALAEGVPVLTSPAGLRGLPANAANVIPVVESPESLCRILPDYADSSARAELASRQGAWAADALDHVALVEDLVSEIRSV